MRISDKIKLAIDIIFGLLIVLEVYRIFRLFRPTKKKLAKLQAKAEKKAQKKTDVKSDRTSLHQCKIYVK